MPMHRRKVLKAALIPLLLPLLERTRSVAATPQARSFSDLSEIRIIQTKDPARILSLVSTPKFATALTQGVLDFIADNHTQGNLPVWKLPLTQVELRPRVAKISAAVIRSVTRHAGIYPVDPCWLMGQIMTESFFNEFAISRSLAVGPCQFLASTAKGYGLVCADAHILPRGVVCHPELEEEFKHHARLRKEITTLRKLFPNLFNAPEKVLRQVLTAQASASAFPDAAPLAEALLQMDDLQAASVTSRDKCRLFLTENFKDRSIFKPRDAFFFQQFDQRVLPDPSVNAMTRFMAENLRSRSGNLLAATAGYNAGLSTTSADWGVYTAYGYIPNINETATYVSKILINHHEISRRL